jgi:hypothetical protein
MKGRYEKFRHFLFGNYDIYVSFIILTSFFEMIFYIFSLSHKVIRLTAKLKKKFLVFSMTYVYKVFESESYWCFFHINASRKIV